MANTQFQRTTIEAWVREQWLPSVYGQTFQEAKLRLSSGGIFAFDAVSADRSIVVNISTSGGATVNGKNAIGKFHKLRGDMLFLTLVEAEQRVMALTEHSMYLWCQKEKDADRTPLMITFVHIELPEELIAQLQIARQKSSDEMIPLQRRK